MSDMYELNDWAEALIEAQAALKRFERCMLVGNLAEAKEAAGQAVIKAQWLELWLRLEKRRD